MMWWRVNICIVSTCEQKIHLVFMMFFFVDFHCGQFFLFWEGFSPWFSQSSLLALDWQEQKISSWISVLETLISWLLGIVNLEWFLSMSCKPVLNTQYKRYGINASNSEWSGVFMQPIGSIGIVSVTNL